MIEKMLKVQILGPKSSLDEVIKALHSAAALHIETVPEEYLREKGFLKKLPIDPSVQQKKEGLERASTGLRNLLTILRPPTGFRPLEIGTEEIPRYLADIVPVEESARELSARKEALNEELTGVEKYEKLLKGFAPIVSRLGGLKNFEITGLTVGKTKEDIPALLEGEVRRITDGVYRVYSKALDEDTTGMVLTYPRAFAQEIKALLTGKAITEIRLPDEYTDMTLIEALKEMGRRRSELPSLIGAIERDLAMVSSHWYETASGVERAVENALEEIGAMDYAAASRYAFMIEGWVPEKRYERLASDFSSAFGGCVLMRTVQVSGHELEGAPVHLRNPGPIRPFEAFLAALPPPKYGSVDPTPYVAFFFPAFFGLIVGDIGYGALIFVLAVYLRFKMKGKKLLADFATILAISSVSAILFGVLFGELFGDLGEKLGIVHPIMFNRIESLKALITVSVGIGIGQVFLGIVLSIINHLSRGRLKEAGSKITFLILKASFWVLIGIAFGFVPRAALAYAAAALGVSLIGIIAFEGILGPIEFMEGIGNIVSYIRLMAVGTASVVMALVANRMGGLFENLALGITIAGLIHLLNLLLSILSPSIQSMRLQYVEFFSKFYEGGGRKYRPFRRH